VGADQEKYIFSKEMMIWHNERIKNDIKKQQTIMEVILSA
jgi:hypothetical protein